MDTALPLEARRLSSQEAYPYPLASNESRGALIGRKCESNSQSRLSILRIRVAGAASGRRRDFGDVVAAYALSTSVHTMDHVRLILKNALGEKAAADFINSALAVENVQDIKKRVCTLLDTRKAENRKVYEVLMREKQRRAAFPEEGYRKINTNPNAPCDLTVSTVQEKVPPKDDEDRVKTDSSGLRKKQKPKFYPLFTEGARGDHLVSLLPGRHPCQCLATKHQLDRVKTDSSGLRKKQKPKFYPLFTEGARGDHLVSLLPGRHPCQCLATKHQLVSNCTSCGRIVCAQEGSGPCFFCGKLVCSKEERDKIALGTKQAVKLKNRLLHAPWAPGTQTPPYRRKSCAKRANAVDVPGSYDDENSQEEDEDWDLIQVHTVKEDAQQRLEEGKYSLAAALANRDRLLEYDVTTARRTRVLDDEMDYFVSEGSGGAAAWLSPEARERVAKRLAELRALRHASRLQGTHLCIDFAGRSVEIVDTRDEAARQLYRPNQEEIDQLEASLRDKESNDLNKGSASSQAVAGRMIDPTLNDQFLQFLPTLTRSQLSVDQAPESSSLMKALKDAPNGLRVQDDISRQLTDEGYCLSMHQPWASFLVRGLKKDEGRDWYSAHRGCLWIASTAKKPDPDAVEQMEQDYLRSGGLRANLPQSYPTGCLLGRVNVVDVLSQEDYRTRFPDGPSESPYVFVCNDPHELLLKLPISGKHKICKSCTLILTI
ncbi:hypothetical protein T265_03633 [Opisthorchis viverrini]|uniref:ASCH domain-containing protein n=1 Tax=Opisthorchis viverrini TaxID=6198 RepID=A0A075A2P9_OPIVI|nr:hypothetical protein T265_03633 [Opisthorchis viverrini]KER29840.1 hypothetical protein T265_03633 [Opisthorchis viverrini]